MYTERTQREGRQAPAVHYITLQSLVGESSAFLFYAKRAQRGQAGPSGSFSGSR